MLTDAVGDALKPGQKILVQAFRGADAVCCTEWVVLQGGNTCWSSFYPI